MFFGTTADVRFWCHYRQSAGGILARRRLFGQFVPVARLISAFRSIVDVGTIDPRIAVFWIVRVAGQLNQKPFDLLQYARL